MSITSVSQAGFSSVASGFSYAFTGLLPYENRSINVVMFVPAIPTVNINDILTHSATISAPANDIMLSNNTFSNSQIVVASYDPNDKMESHGGKILTSQFNQNDYLYYAVRFQNTGTSNAINIKLEDFLNAQLDESSIRMIDASHNYVMKRVGNKITWKFDYINSVGAVQNDALSKGYVSFKIELKPGFSTGTIILNNVSIYFDSYPAIVINTFNTQFVSTLACTSFDGSNFVLYPNPASNYVELSLQNTNEKLQIITVYDVIDKNIKQIKNVTSNQIMIDTSELFSGLYFVEIATESKLKQNKKLIIN